MYPLPFFLFFIPFLSSYFYSSSSILLFLPIPSCSSFSSSWILLYFTFFSLLLVFHLLLLSLFFLFISLSHSFILLFLYLPFLLPHSSCFYLLSFISITVYSSSFSHPLSSLPLFFLLYSLVSIFSVPQSPLLLPPHSFPFFFFNVPPSPPYPFLHISIFISLFILS